jgi:hypothetical protein
MDEVQKPSNVSSISFDVEIKHLFRPLSKVYKPIILHFVCKFVELSV